MMDTRDQIDGFNASLLTAIIAGLDSKTVGPAPRRFFDPKGWTHNTIGLRLGEWAIHRADGDSGQWQVTHCPSGLGASPVPDPIEALIQLGAMMGSGLDFSGLDAGYDFAEPPEVDTEARERYRRAMATVSMWGEEQPVSEPAARAEPCDDLAVPPWLVRMRAAIDAAAERKA